MKIKKNAVVSLHYILTGEDGEVIDRSDEGEPLMYIHGHGALIPGLESELEGKEIEAKFEVRIEPENGYGEYDDNLIAEVNKAQFEAEGELQVGQQFEAETEDGPTMVTITDINDELITIDGNHPLAGMVLNFEVAVMGVRAATKEELEHGHAHGDDGCEGDEI